MDRGNLTIVFVLCSEVHEVVNMPRVQALPTA